MVLNSKPKPGRKSSFGEFYPPGFRQSTLFCSPVPEQFTHLTQVTFFLSVPRSDVDIQILMLSGIGPAAQLAFHDVLPLVDLPGVGEHLMDHPVVGMNLLDKSGHSLGWMKSEGLSFGLISAILQWSWRGTGPLTTNVSCNIAGSIIGG